MENRQSNKKTVSSGAVRAIGCRREPSGIVFYNKMNRKPVGWVWVSEQADDQANSSLRDEVQQAIYGYGKGRGMLP